MQCGLNFDGIGDDEKGLLPPGSNERQYARVRNAVLTQWRQNVSQKLSVYDAIAAAKQQDQAYALAAWRFLNSKSKTTFSPSFNQSFISSNINLFFSTAIFFSSAAKGYINYGVSPDIQHDVATTPDSRGTVLVIGAGCAGLATARQLRCAGYRVLIVEGRSRPGGRVFTDGLHAPNSALGAPHGAAVVADIGGSIITGIDGNPLAVLVKQLGLPLSHIRDQTPIYMPDGSLAVEKIDTAVESLYNSVMMKGCSKMRENPQEVDDMSLLTALETLWSENYDALEKSLSKGSEVQQPAPPLPPPRLTRTAAAAAATVATTTAPAATTTAPTTSTTTTIKATKTTKTAPTDLQTTVPIIIKETAPPSPRPISSLSTAEERRRIRGRGLSSQIVPLTNHPASLDLRLLFEWHLANLEFANACRLEHCSLLHWDQDDPHELPGPHCFVPGGNSRWLKSLCEGVAILYDSPVSEIRYCKSGVAVHTQGNAPKVLHADAVVVTAPLGVLKRGAIAFNPPLPERKQKAIARLGFGNLNKVILMFPHVFWSQEEDMFGHISADVGNRGEAFLFYSYAGVSGGAQLTALMAGGAADDQERRSGPESAARVMSILRDIFESKGVEVPPPLQVIVTRWGSDPMSYGAYSSLTPGSKGGIEYDTFAESVGGRVFFAGEATTRRYPATMHGAYFSGLWAAADVDASLSKQKGVPQAGCAAAGAAVEAVTAAQVLRQAAMKSESENLRKFPNKKASSSSYTPYFTMDQLTDAAAATAEAHNSVAEKVTVDKLMLSSRLRLLFDDPLHPPDLEFGAFKAVFGARGSVVAERALLRIDATPSSRPKSCSTPRVVVYCVVDRDVVYALMEMVDNPARFALLGSLPGVDFKERASLNGDAVEIMKSVMTWRRRGGSPGGKSGGDSREGSEKLDGSGGVVVLAPIITNGTPMTTAAAAAPLQQQQQNGNGNGSNRLPSSSSSFLPVAAAPITNNDGMVMMMIQETITSLDAPPVHEQQQQEQRQQEAVHAPFPPPRPPPSTVEASPLKKATAAAAAPSVFHPDLLLSIAAAAGGAHDGGGPTDGADALFFGADMQEQKQQ